LTLAALRSCQLLAVCFFYNRVRPSIASCPSPSPLVRTKNDRFCLSFPSPISPDTIALPCFPRFKFFLPSFSYAASPTLPSLCETINETPLIDKVEASVYQLSAILSVTPPITTCPLVGRNFPFYVLLTFCWDPPISRTPPLS